MKKSNILKPVSLSVVLAVLPGLVDAAPYGPEGRSTQWVQPSGETLELRVFGDEYYGRTETPAGYSVVYSPADGAYHFAELSADGTALVPAPTLANEPAPVGQAPHLDLPAAQIKEIVLANRVKFDGDRQQLWRQRVKAVQQVRAAANGPALRGTAAAADKAKAAPIVGNKRGLTILVQFPDDSKTSGSDPVDFPATRSKIVRFCNEVGYNDDGNTGSVRDYFYDQSLGQLTYTQNVTQIITVPKARNYYNFSDYPANKNLRGDASRVLITDAVAVLKASGFDFTSLTTDDNDFAVATNVFFAGPDSGVFANGLWPQQWSLAGPISVGTVATPVFISKFQITNAVDNAPVIGTFCHENGHLILNYPDIYSQFPTGEGVGEHCLMGSGNYLNRGKTPSPINAYFKDIVGWANVTELTPAEFRTTSLPAKGNVAYRLRNPAAVTESFMVENRGEGDKWAKYSDDKGIVIWHIDETVDGNLNTGTHYEVAIEQADGRMDLENNQNRGDSSDYFDFASKAKFNDTTNPNARWWDGTRSAIKVEVLTDLAPSISVLFGGVPPNTIIVGKPNGGEVVYPDSTQEISWQANIAGGVKIELFKGGVFKSVIALNEANDGRYDWAVPVNFLGGKDYTIQISSISNPVPTFDTSDGTFEINDTTFPADGVKPYGWYRPTGATTTWEVTKSVAYEGAASLVSRNPGDGNSAAIAYRANFKSGIASFYIKVSSEDGYDLARFYIDGKLQSLPGGGSKLGISGRTGWTFASFPVSKGKHTFTWTYEKDDSYGGALDRAWLDGVALPATTQEIAVIDSKGVELVDGEAMKSFPAVVIGRSSAAQTFTVKNVGKAALFGLKVAMTGVNSKDFTAKSIQKAVLQPGESTTFDVAFTPTHVGPLVANVQVLSNDENEGSFDIRLEGIGIGLPRIAVFQADGSKLKDDGSKLDFGTTVVGSDSKTKTFTIKNQGSAALKGLKISGTGGDKADFVISPPGRTNLGPGATATFKVTFHPTARRTRTASFQILSNDKKSGPFDITFSGTGAPKIKANLASTSALAAALASPSSSKARQLPPITSVEVIQGRKYLALTVTKQAGNAASVEVSPDLLDWFSGNKHTTVLIDDATILKVRDNTPVTRDVKRYIRLR